jgi:hypothetical protein
MLIVLYHRIYDIDDCDRIFVLEEVLVKYKTILILVYIINLITKKKLCLVGYCKLVNFI